MKEQACILAFQLIQCLSNISDMDFVDDILSALDSGDTFEIQEIWDRGDFDE